MKCPRCNESLPLVLCPSCGGEILKTSLFCSWCGHPIPKEEEEADFLERKLCSDGNCIGVINEEGVCNICGKPYAGEPL